MLTPDGHAAGKIDKIMLLSMWAHARASELQTQSPVNAPRMIYAGIGKPTYSLNEKTRRFLADFWTSHSGAAISYGHPQGDADARRVMAEAMTRWYNVKIDSRDILFTVGGVGALRTIFSALHAQFVDEPNFRVITPFPYYPLYADSDLKLHPVPVMKELGYRLTAEGLEKSILSAQNLAKEDHGFPRVLLICDPNNPLGSVLGVDELIKIAHVLRKHPGLLIILDEAYAEIILDGSKHISLLTVAPDLKNRVVALRSATKGLSAAGERMAISMVFDKDLMSSLLHYSIRSYGHAPRSLQKAYAQTMLDFGSNERAKLGNFYKKNVEFVFNRLIELGAAMPDPHYQVQGTFYVLADLGDIIGAPLPESTYKALHKRGKISSDEDLAYYLLFEEAMMIAPGSYFGLTSSKGYMRITCSAEDLGELKILMNRLERQLIKARLTKQEELTQKIQNMLPLLGKINKNQYDETILIVNKLMKATERSCLELLQYNKLLKSLLIDIKKSINQSSDAEQAKAVTLIQALYRANRAKQIKKQIMSNQNKAWSGFIDQISPNKGKIRSYLQQLSAAERLELIPWKEHLKNSEEPYSWSFFLEALADPNVPVIVAFLLTVVATALLVHVLGAASIGAASLAAVATAGVGLGLIGLGLFSSKIKEFLQLDQSEERERSGIFQGG